MLYLGNQSVSKTFLKLTALNTPNNSAAIFFGKAFQIFHTYKSNFKHFIFLNINLTFKKYHTQKK
jgi:hypothetical protein